MSLPGVIPAGVESNALVELLDLFPTFTELAGCETPSTVQGISLIPLITGRSDRHKSVVYSEFPLPRKNVGGGEFYATMMMFDGRYKLIDNGPDSFPELYDHVNDKGEFNNIAGEPSQTARVKKMLTELREWHQKDLVKNQPTGAQLRKNSKSTEE